MRKFKLNSLVLQPTTLCQLDCSYCYLPYRKDNKQMAIETVRKVAAQMTTVDRAYLGDELTVFWHGGEPLLRGASFFLEAIDIFNEIVASPLEVDIIHCFQTNAARLSDDMLPLLKHPSVRIGISIDGPRECNTARVNYSGREAWEDIMTGMKWLQEHQIDFATISVIGPEAMKNIPVWLDFIKATGSVMIGVNFQEEIGLSKQSTPVDYDHFWKTTINCWKDDPELPLRELIRIYQVISRPELVEHNPEHDLTELFVGVAYDGSISLLSPEFVEINDNTNQKVAGHVDSHPLSLVIDDAENGRIDYVNDYLTGKARCRKECDFFQICGGGSAANKFYETGSCNATLTHHCRSTIISPTFSLLNAFTHEAIAD